MVLDKQLNDNKSVIAVVYIIGLEIYQEKNALESG
jgi:hypothetical protein